MGHSQASVPLVWGLRWGLRCPGKAASSVPSPHKDGWSAAWLWLGRMGRWGRARSLGRVTGVSRPAWPSTSFPLSDDGLAAGACWRSTRVRLPWLPELSLHWSGWLACGIRPQDLHAGRRPHPARSGLAPQPGLCRRPRACDWAGSCCLPLIRAHWWLSSPGDPCCLAVWVPWASPLDFGEVGKSN